jgi:nucleoid DNA-binding protein
MANEKFTWLELRKAVAQMAGTGEQVTGLFLDSLVDAIVAGLEKDKQVKIKGIGTFALKPMAARKSVNIATGEDFVIAGYNKLTFNPESSLKENIEKRIDSPKTTEVINEITQDPLKKLGEQATEIVDILADLGQSPVGIEEVASIPTPTVETKEEPAVETQEEPTVETKEEPVIETKEEPVVETKEEPVIETKEEPTVETKEEPMIETKEEPVVETQEEPVIETKEEPVIETQEEPVIETQEEQNTEKVVETKPTCSKKWICWLIVIIVLLGLGGAGWYYRDIIKQYLPLCYCNEKQCEKKVVEEYKTNEPTEEIITADSLVVANDSIEETDNCSQKCGTTYKKRVRRFSKKHPHFDPPREYSKFIATERVNKDSRLTWIAKKYYGHKDLWVFIYEANMDVIDDPAHIEIGQHLRIPELGPCCNDINNPETRKLVDELTEEYLNESK